MVVVLVTIDGCTIIISAIVQYCWLLVTIVVLNDGIIIIGSSIIIILYYYWNYCCWYSDMTKFIGIGNVGWPSSVWGYWMKCCKENVRLMCGDVMIVICDWKIVYCIPIDAIMFLFCVLLLVIYYLILKWKVLVFIIID